MLLLLRLAKAGFEPVACLFGTGGVDSSSELETSLHCKGGLVGTSGCTLRGADFVESWTMRGGATEGPSAPDVPIRF